METSLYIGISKNMANSNWKQFFLKPALHDF